MLSIQPVDVHYCTVNFGKSAFFLNNYGPRDVWICSNLV
jgi:hypothetical protein